MDLAPREIHVLALVAELYIETGRPVGSKAVAERSHLELSSATMRNIMADLRERGYLEQPHTSAGSAPTPQGMRAFLDTSLIPRDLTGEERETIAKGLGGDGMEVDEILRRASRILSKLSLSVSMVLAPVADSARWKHVDFVQVGPGLIMAILVLQGGIVQKRVIRTDEEFTADELVSYSNYLNELFGDRTVRQAQARIVRDLKSAGEGISILARRALELAQWLIRREAEDRELFVDGTANILAESGITDLKSMRGLLVFLEERSRLLDLLARTARERGVNITLGAEAGEEGLESLGIVASPYIVGNEPAGVIGVLGPLRMDYAAVAPTVDFTARMLTRLLTERL